MLRRLAECCFQYCGEVKWRDIRLITGVQRVRVPPPLPMPNRMITPGEFVRDLMATAERHGGPRLLEVAAKEFVDQWNARIDGESVKCDHGHCKSEADFRLTHVNLCETHHARWLRKNSSAIREEVRSRMVRDVRKQWFGEEDAAR